MKQLLILVMILFSAFAAKAQNTQMDLFDQSTVKMSEIKTNTIRSDFGPAVIDNFIYFTSFRDEVINKSDKELIEKEFYDLYKAGIDDSGNVTGNRQAIAEFITRFHDGPVSWCARTGANRSSTRRTSSCTGSSRASALP